MLTFKNVDTKEEKKRFRMSLMKALFTNVMPSTSPFHIDIII